MSVIDVTFERASDHQWITNRKTGKTHDSYDLISFDQQNK